MAKTKKVVGMKVVSPGSPPDIDSDFSVTAREKAVEYVTELYGKENVANIVTFGTLATKSAFKSMMTSTMRTLITTRSPLTSVRLPLVTRSGIVLSLVPEVLLGV